LKIKLGKGMDNKVRCLIYECKRYMRRAKKR